MAHFRRLNIRTILTILGSVCAIVLVSMWISQAPWKTTIAYSLAFGTIDTQAASPNFYLTEQSIDSERVSAPHTIDDTTYRTLSGTSARFMFKPEFSIASLRSLDAHLTISNPTTSLTLTTPGTEEGRTHELPLYIPGLEHMAKSAVHSTINPETTFFVYTKPDIEAPKNDLPIESWLSDHADTPSHITSELASEIDWAALGHAPESDFTQITLDSNIHGSASFVMYAPQEFHLSMKKINKNILRVDDGARIVIRDRVGKTVAETRILDDGIENGKREQTSQDLEWNPRLPADAVYTLEIIKNDTASHSVLTDITLSTPYIALTHGIVSTASNIRTVVKNIHVPINVSFVENSGESTLSFSGPRPFTYTTRGQSLLVDHIYAQETGEYAFNINEQIELSNGMFLLGDSKAFEPSVLASTSIAPEIIVTGIDLTSTDKGTITVRNTWNQAVVSDMVQGDTTHTVGIELIQSDLLQPRLFTTAINNYNTLWSGCGVSLFSQDEYPEGTFKRSSCSQKSELSSLLSALLPRHISITSLSTEIDRSRLYTATLGNIDDVNTRMHTLSPNLRGDHTFVAYAPEGLNLTVESTDLNASSGQDTVIVSIVDEFGKNLGKGIMNDDGIVSSTNTLSSPRSTHITTQSSTSGMYIIRIYAQENDQQDFLIDTLSLTTNKIMALNYVSTYSPITIYTDLPTVSAIDLYVSSKASKDEDDDLIVDANTLEQQTIPFNAQNDRITQSILFSQGRHTFTINQAKMNIRGLNSAFSTDGAFTFGPYTFGHDYLIVDEDTWGKTRLHSLLLQYSR